MEHDNTLLPLSFTSLKSLSLTKYIENIQFYIISRFIIVHNWLFWQFIFHFHLIVESNTCSSSCVFVNLDLCWITLLDNIHTWYGITQKFRSIRQMKLTWSQELLQPWYDVKITLWNLSTNDKRIRSNQYYHCYNISAFTSI